MPGFFITFEGGEGAGKSTQIRRIGQALTEAGHSVVITREPGGSPGAETIRDLFVSGAPDRWDAVTELLLATAARRDHVRQTIAPALAAGQIVLSDRFVHSTLAYQVGRDDVTEEQVMALHRLALGELWPDLTFVFDLDPQLAKERITARDGEKLGRFERMDPAFHARLRERFSSIAQSDDVCLQIDAAAPMDDITTTLLDAINARCTL
ncbi:MAG: dTMP kinase [Pseudomonadota bacterium]